METRFNDRTSGINIVINTLAIMFSVGIMIYGIFHFGLKETWPELILNLFYIACIVMIWLYFFIGRPPRFSNAEGHFRHRC